MVALALGATLGGVMLAGAVPLEFITADDRGEFNVWVERPLGSSLAQTQESVAAVEAELRTWPEVRLTFATIGHGVKRRVNEATVYVQLVHKSDRDQSTAGDHARLAGATRRPRRCRSRSSRSKSCRPWPCRALATPS